MTKAYYSISIITAIALLLSACQPTQVTPVASKGTQDDIGELHVTRTEPTKTATKVEEFPLPNCGGTDKLTQSLGTQASVLKGLTVGTKATLAGGVEVEVPEIVKFKLEQKVEDAYQEEYQTANSRIDALNMTAAPGTHVVYVILWEDSKYSSEISYVMNGAVYKVPYTYILSVPKISESRKVDCPGDEPAQSPNNAVVSTPVQPLAPPPTIAPTQPSASQPSKPANGSSQFPERFLSETQVPNGTNLTFDVEPGAVHVMTSGPICIEGTCLSGGEKRGSVVVFLPRDTPYKITGLVPYNNWHGGFYADTSQWQVLADTGVAGMQNTASVNCTGGCRIVDVLIIGPNGIVTQYIVQ